MSDQCQAKNVETTRMTYTNELDINPCVVTVLAYVKDYVELNY